MLIAHLTQNRLSAMREFRLQDFYMADIVLEKISVSSACDPTYNSSSIVVGWRNALRRTNTILIAGLCISLLRIVMVSMTI